MVVGDGGVEGTHMRRIDGFSLQVRTALGRPLAADAQPPGTALIQVLGGTAGSSATLARLLLHTCRPVVEPCA